MADRIQVAAFEGGSLRVFGVGEKAGEAVLALPLSRLIVKILRVPAENKEDSAGFATPLLAALSPFPDEALTVSCETVSESDEGRVVIAAALPESATEDIAEALDAAKLNVTRVDALELGFLRREWKDVVGGAAHGRRLVVLPTDDGVSLIVLDGDGPVALRSVNAASDLRRELMLVLLEAEDFGGSKMLGDIVVVKGQATPPAAPAEASTAEGEGIAPEADAGASAPAPKLDIDWAALLSPFGPVREFRVDDRDAALAGVAERSLEPGSLDALPESWREVLAETRFKAKLVRAMVVAGSVWALAMGVLFGVPVAYGFMTDYQKQLCKEHQKQYRAVSEMRDKVKLVRKYSDHSRGALEILKAVSDRMPEGVELTSWSFKREEGVKFAGEAEDANAVYRFKDLMTETEVFADVVLQGPSAGKGGKQRFDLDCQYETEEE